MNTLKYDSPEDITSVELNIQSVSGNTSPVIYANGLNQLPVEIIAKAMKEDEDGNEVVLHFAPETWIHILNLRHAESDKKLNWLGNSGWCFTATENNYSREVVIASTAVSSGSFPAVCYSAPGSVTVTMYVYTDDVNTKRIAVSIDTDGGKHFTTADNASGAEKSSVTVKSIQKLTYLRDNIVVDVIKNMGTTKCLLTISTERGDLTSNFNGHYDNIYISVGDQIENASVYGYGNGGKYPERVSQYWTQNNNQHMLISNPYNYPEGSGLLGFHGTATADYYDLGSADWDYSLFQNFKYNNRSNEICYTHFYFDTAAGWDLPDNQGLKVNNNNFGEYSFAPWFELYDIYGNHGKFSIKYDKAVGDITIEEK